MVFFYFIFYCCFFREHKDLALVSLANILHRSKYSLDAAILMHAALETTSDFDIIYFTLGNIYGVSIMCYLFALYRSQILWLRTILVRLKDSKYLKRKYGRAYSRMDQVNLKKFFKGCPLQLLLGPFLNKLSHI